MTTETEATAARIARRFAAFDFRVAGYGRWRDSSIYAPWEEFRRQIAADVPASIDMDDVDHSEWPNGCGVDVTICGHVYSYSYGHHGCDAALDLAIADALED